MVAIIQKRYNYVTNKNSNCQKSPIKIDALMKSVYNILKVKKLKVACEAFRHCSL
jgi:hypothetical protein